MTRAQNLFMLGHLCGVTPRDADEMLLDDFIQLLAGIRQYEAANKPKPGGDQ